MLSEKELEQKHFIELVTEAAKYNERVAFCNLQDAKTEFDQFEACQELETWKGVLTLVKHREDLIKNIKLLILESRTPPDVVLAVKENLKEMGVII